MIAYTGILKKPGKFILLLAGLILGVVFGFGAGLFILPLGPPRWIIFPDRSVSISGFGDYAVIQGRIDDRPGYPNNFVHVTCRKELQACIMVKLEQIDMPEKSRGGFPQLGYVDPGEIFKISRWDTQSLVAISETFCEVRQLNADFAMSDAELVIQPQNLTDIACRGTTPNLVRYPIEKSLDAFDPKYGRR